MTLTVGSLFSGIGGLDLGLERAGMKIIWQSEIDPYANNVLKKHWPNVTNHGDIKSIDWKNIERPNVICGGYPCQPFSVAGTRRGSNDPRHLWPYVKDAISNLRPDYAIMENVRGHLSMGFTDVLSDLTDIGYDAEWRVISAATVGGNHQRERLFIVAYPYGVSVDYNYNDEGDTQTPSNAPVFVAVARSNSTSRPDGRRIPEPYVDRTTNGVPNRVDRLRGLGNAVVPQVAGYVGRAVVEHWQNNIDN